MENTVENIQLVKKREAVSPVEKGSAILKAADHTSLTEYKLTIYENIWRIIFVILLVVGAIAIERVYTFHTSPSMSHIPKGSIFDFWIAVVAALIIGAIRYFIITYFQDSIIGLLSEKRRKTPEEAKKRAEQLCKWFFDFCYYTITSISGYLIVKDQAFLPPALGGSGSCSNLFQGYPYVPEIPFLKVFYLIQTGTHLYTFAYQVIVKYNDPKFYEYALHHGLALFLLWFSYMMNFIVVGVIVLLVHDPSDVFLIAARAYTDIKNRNVVINVLIYAVTYPVWVYTRNMVFPVCVLGSAISEYWSQGVVHLDEVLYLPAVFMIFMMAALVIMHFYWTFFLTKAAISMVKGGKDKNGYDS